MGWTLERDYVVCEQDFHVRIAVDAYVQGVTLIPRVFLDEADSYGFVMNTNRVFIDKDRYLDVVGRLRRGILWDENLRKHLGKITYSALGNLRVAIDRLETAVLTAQARGVHLEEAITAFSAATSLAEFNGILPIGRLREILADHAPELHIEDFAYSRVLPHLLLLYRGKLLLASRYYREGACLRLDSVQRYCSRYGYLDYDRTNPMLDCATEDPITARLEVMTLARDLGSMESVDAEIAALSRKRMSRRLQYRAGLKVVETAMQKNNVPDATVQNVIGALRCLSLATTEEEHRHILQARLWRILRSIARGLDVPACFVTAKQLALEMDRRPNTIYDLKQRMRW
jgi:tetratricopeptide (TPR) repeat protein